MKNQPNRDYISNDDISTPKWLAQKMVERLKPTGLCLEPCAGNNVIYNLLPDPKIRYEIKEGTNFYYFDQKVDWIITNPPWSEFRHFLHQSVQIADNIAFLATVNHWWTKARVNLVRENNFGYHSILLVEYPKEFPSSGFQLGVVYIKRGWTNTTIIENL